MIAGLAERLKTSRNNVNLTRKQVAERIGVSETMMRFYESGERQPSLFALIKLAGTYKVSTDYLLGYEPKNPTTISLAGLSETQIRAITLTVQCFRNQI